MATFKIEKGIPLPQKQTFASALRSMDVGDSIFIPKEEANNESLRAMASRLSKKDSPKHWTCRVVYDDGGNNTGIRIWRTK